MNNKEPVVLGELKKEKSSKPIFVILCFALLLGTCFGLPYIKNYLNTEDNSFTRFYRSIFGSLTEDTGTDATTTTTTKTLEQTDLTILLSSSTINYQSLSLTDFKLDGIYLSYHITNSNSNLNLDNEKIYLEIYSNSKLVTRVKLIGKIDSTGVNMTSKMYQLTASSSGTYYGKIVKLSVSDYPEVTLINQTLTCKDNKDTFIYTFNNNQLVSLNHTYSYTYAGHETDYLNKFNESNLISNKIKTLSNCTSSTTENDSGFIFTANLDLKDIKISELGDYINYSYFDFNTPSKEVSYEMLTKGYDCQ